MGTGTGGGHSLRTTPIVLPVRFVAGGQAVQCTTRELSVEGAFVSCPSPPRTGTLLSLRLYLPGARAPEELAAVVRAAVASGEPRALGFWADFAPGNEDAQERIAQVLVRVAQERGLPVEGVAEPPQNARALTPASTARLTPSSLPRMPLTPMTPSAGVPRLPAAARPGSDEPTTAPIALPPPASDRRRERRVAGEQPIAVRFGSVEEFVLEYAANISAGGVFIRTDHPPPLETRVTVWLELPDGSPPAEVTAIVVHRLDPAEAGLLREAGAGVQFVAPDAAFLLRIEQFLDWALEQ